MKSRNIYVQTLFSAIKDKKLSTDERNHRARTAINAILDASSLHTKFEQELKETIKVDPTYEVGIDVVDENGKTALMLAVEENYIVITRELLAANANPNVAEV